MSKDAAKTEWASHVVLPYVGCKKHERCMGLFESLIWAVWLALTPPWTSSSEWVNISVGKQTRATSLKGWEDSLILSSSFFFFSCHSLYSIPITWSVCLLYISASFDVFIFVLYLGSPHILLHDLFTFYLSASLSHILSSSSHSHSLLFPHLASLSFTVGYARNTWDQSIPSDNMTP